MILTFYKSNLLGSQEEVKRAAYMFNKTVLQLIPALLSVRGVLFKHSQAHQVLSVNVAQSVEVDQFLAEEKFQEFPKMNELMKAEIFDKDF